MADVFVAPKNPPADGKKAQEKPIFRTNSSSLNNSEKVSILSTFRKNPKGISFQAQKGDETILIFLRSHLITNLSWFLAGIAFALIPAIAPLILPILNIDIFFSSNIIRFTIIYIILYYLIVFSYLFINFLHWFYSVFMVTTRQVVDIDYSDIVIHHVAITSLSQVQDTKYIQSGFIATAFDYGDIFIQTAGTEKNFQEPSVPRPREATHLIGDIIGKGRGIENFQKEIRRKTKI